ncbi:MAG: hypothetical protein AAF702_42780 [Chloroflexota bacterium]
MIDQTNPRARYYENFQQVATQLQEQPWYTDAWQIVVKYYGEGNSRNPGFTLYKSNWFDGGIHFESWMGNADVKRSAVPISMHFETNYDKSGIRRGKFHEYILEEGKAVIDELNGYTVSAKSMQLLINRKPYTEDTFVDMMVQEYCTLQKLATVIDAAIEAVQEK